MFVSALQVLDVEEEPTRDAHEDPQRRAAPLLHDLRPRFHGEIPPGQARAYPLGGKALQVFKL